MTFYDETLSEETIKSKVAADFFAKFDTTKHEHNIDFMVADKHQEDDETDYYLWAEAKKGVADIYKSLTQLIMTANKAETITHPNYFGAFDAQKIAFLDNYDIQKIFADNDIDKKAAPSDYKSPEFQKIHAIVKDTLEKSSYIFYFDKDKQELKEFIKKNFVFSDEKTQKIIIHKNNFQKVFYKWLNKVKPAISCDWEEYKADIIEADFFIADLLSKDDKTIRENLKILLEKDKYTVKENVIKHGKNKMLFDKIDFIDKSAHENFWKKYERPPEKVVQDFIIDHRCVLLPQDYRERTGAFYTPEIWVKKAQDYLAQTLGKQWQDEYYIWDCAAGSGNLLVGLTNKYNVFASTLDRADYYGMIDRVENKTLNLLKEHIFQFDFLNDDFFNKFDNAKLLAESKLPKALQDILNDENKRKRLLIFINPPYKTSTSTKTIAGTGTNKAGVSKTFIGEKYKDILGEAKDELFTQFFIRIYQEIPNCILASFSKLKYINSQNCANFRQNFQAKFLNGFMCHSKSFKLDGDFPIGFLIWDLKQKQKIIKIQLDVFESDGEFKGKKNYFAMTDKKTSLQKWWVKFEDNLNDILGFMSSYPCDFQNQSKFSILLKPQKRYCLNITKSNLIPFSVYFAVRKAIKATWINDRDQFLYPNEKWQNDTEFQNDCLIFTLFHSQNKITSKDGINHFIPFSESEVDAKEKFASDFMFKFLQGKHGVKPNKTAVNEGTLFDKKELNAQNFIPTKPLKFSPQAQKVLNAGRELWAYYHSQDFKNSQKPYNANASLYDIREYFQGVKMLANGKTEMNTPKQSKDEHYKTLYKALQDSLNALATKITPKIYEYGFLME